MKKFLCLIAGLISTSLVSGLVVLIGIYTNFDVQSFGIFFIIPMGSILIGLVAITGYGVTAKHLNVKIEKVDYLFAALFAVLAVFLIYFLFYKVSYVDEKDQVYYSLSPGFDTPLEKVTFEDGSTISFMPYFLTSIENRQITFAYQGQAVLKTPSNPVVGWLDFLIELFGYFVGTMAGLSFIVNTKFCDHCKIYYKKKKWLESDISHTETIKRVDEALKNHSNLQEVLENISPSSGAINMVFEGESCKQCGDGIFRIKFNKLKKDGDRDDIDEWKQEISIKNNIPLGSSFSLSEFTQKILKEALKDASI